MSLEDLLDKMGNEVISLIATTRNLGADYQKLLEALTLAKSPAGKAFREPMQIRDRCIAVVRTRDGKVKLDENGEPMIRDTGWSENGLTNAGFASVAGLILTDVGDTPYDYLAIGTGSTAFDPTQTALVTEIKRKAGTGTRVTTSVTNDTSNLTTTFSSADTLSGTSSVTESGVFNQSSGGTMLCRQTFSALNINWGAGEKKMKASSQIHVAGDLEIWCLSQTRRFKPSKAHSLQHTPVYVGRHPSFFGG
jgi:hypothetical protein